jgi:hypothetical protein
MRLNLHVVITEHVNGWTRRYGTRISRYFDLKEKAVVGREFLDADWSLRFCSVYCYLRASSSSSAFYSSSCSSSAVGKNCLLNSCYLIAFFSWRSSFAAKSNLTLYPECLRAQTSSLVKNFTYLMSFAFLTSSSSFLANLLNIAAFLSRRSDYTSFYLWASYIISFYGRSLRLRSDITSFYFNTT